MVILAIVLSGSFSWLLYETKWLTIRLVAGPLAPIEPEPVVEAVVHPQAKQVVEAVVRLQTNRVMEAVAYLLAITAVEVVTIFLHPLWGIAALAGSMLVSYSRARAEAAEIKMESVGFAERAERMLILAIASIAAIFWLPALNIGIILLAVLSNLTVLQRGIHVYNSLKKKGNNLES